MKRLLSVIFICTLFQSLLFSNTSLVNETIRRKIENLPVFHALNREFQIYCTLSLREVYIHNDFKPFWVDESIIEEFISIIASCEEEGLHPEDYHLSDIIEIKQNNTIDAKADLDILLSDGLLLYLSHILAGKVNPITIDAQWHLVKTDTNPLKYFYQLNSKSLIDIIKEVSPKNKNYEALKVQLQHYKELAGKQQPEFILKGQVLKPGMNDARIAQIRQVLAFYDNDSVNNNLYSEYYDDTLRLAIIEFQKQNGLEALGTIGDQTIETFNIPINKKIESIEVNLERLRWLPQELPNYYLMVNIVNFELDVIEDNELVQKHKVIVGKPYRATPVFSSTMQYIVFNPTWTVPPTILKEDLIPEVKKNVKYLSDKNIFVYNNQGKRLNPDSIDWSNSKVFSYIYRQESGKSNALGLVKFMFPNQFNVYLHDTPSREMFQRTERAFSSGCIRVQQPLNLAEYLLKDQSKYSLQEIKKIIETNKTQTVILKKRPEVFLLYLTTWVDEKGKINFRKDIYERDKKLFTALNVKPFYNIDKN